LGPPWLNWRVKRLEKVAEIQREINQVQIDILKALAE
jgi:hypothetical protein